MAANLQGGRAVVAGIGRRVARIGTGGSSLPWQLLPVVLIPRDWENELNQTLHDPIGLLDSEELLQSYKPVGLSFYRRGFQSSAYDKNPDEPVRASAVPDDVVEPKSNKYWEPNPKTGVFGPADQNGEVGMARGSSPGNGNTVLDQGVWFRPLEDVEKPPPA